MTVVFWDVRRATCKRVENVESVEETWSMGRNGRPTKFWSCFLQNGKPKTVLQQRHYTIKRIY